MSDLLYCEQDIATLEPPPPSLSRPLDYSRHFADGGVATFVSSTSSSLELSLSSFVIVISHSYLIPSHI